MLKRHEIEILLKAGHGKAEVARLSGASLRSVKRIDLLRFFQQCRFVVLTT